MTHETLIGIDAGTSAVKVCAFDRDGRLLAKAQRNVPLMTPYPLWAEIDVDRYWELVSEALRDVGARVTNVVGIGFATTCPTMIALDADDQSIGPAPVYLDGRTDALIADVLGADAARYSERTGNRASVSTVWASHALWLRRNDAAAWTRVRRIAMLNSWLAFKLTGAWGIDSTQMSYSGLVDVRRSDPEWSDDLLRLWQIDRALLPPVQRADKALGRTHSAFGDTLPAGIPVSLGAADTAAASLAIGLNKDKDAFESIGTSGVLTVCLDRPNFDETFMNRYHVLPQRWLAHGAMSTLGGAFGWLNSKVWPELRSFADLERLAEESVPGANGLVFLPYLAGERSPHWDTAASGGWLGLRLSHSRADMIRAVFEGTTFGLRQIFDHARDRWNWHPAYLMGVGGGARSRFIAQMKADILGLEYRTADMADAAALGAALMGGVAGGVYASLTDPELPRIQATSSPFKPGMQDRRRVYEQAFSVYARLYGQLRDTMHQLGALSTP